MLRCTGEAECRAENWEVITQLVASRRAWGLVVFVLFSFRTPNSQK